MLQDLKMRDCHITLGEGGVVMPDLYTSAYTTSTTTTTTTTARSSRRKAHTSNISSSGATFFNARNGGVGGSGRKPLPSKIPHQTVNVVIHNNTNMDIGDSLEIPLAHSPAASESASVTTISTNQSPVLLPHHQVPVCSSSPLLPPLPPSTAHNPPPSSSSATTLFIQGKLPPPPPSSQSPASPGSDSGESVSSAATRASNISSRTNRTTSASANKTTKSVVRQDNSSSTIGVLHHRAAQKARWMHKSNMEEAWKFMSSMSFKKTSKKK